MIQTYNISLPAKLANQVNQVIDEQGFSSRSELFRTALRIYLRLTKTTTIPELESFTPTPLSKIKKDLESDNKHSQTFINSVIKGLKKSSAYERQTSKI